MSSLPKYKTSQLKLLECNIDDLNPEFYPSVIENLLSVGGKDAWLTPIIMKNGRPGTVLSVLFCEDISREITDIVFRETSTLGVRLGNVERLELERRDITVDTKFGQISVKEGLTLSGELLNIAPEYSSCRAAAKYSGSSIKAVYQAALAAWHNNRSKS